MNWVQKGSECGDTPPFEMPPVIWQVVSRRGFTSAEQIEDLFNPKLKNLSHPFSITDMDLAVERLVKAFEENEAVLIYGDYDLDGTPGVVVLLEGLRKLGFKKLSYYQPSRSKDGYGLHAHKMPEFKDQNIKLIVTVDVGITDIEAVDQARALGIDVIITDHHLPKESLPHAVAIVNPNKGDCGSQLQHLCGAGVAFYLILALRMEMAKKELLTDSFEPKELLDLFALATVTDMVPLVRENRVLVKHGLVQLRQTQRPGLRRLLAELGFLGKPLSSQDIAFRIAPKLNALTRIDEGLRAIDVLLADESRAPKIIDQVLMINEKRVQLQAQARKVANDLIANQSGQGFIWIHSHEFHPGVISLLANDIMGEQSIPVFVGATNEEGQILGSARAPHDAYNLQSALQFASPKLKRWGGHQLAAGFELSSDSQSEFQALLTEYYAKLQSDDGASGGEGSNTSVTDQSELAGTENSGLLKSESRTYDAEVRISDLNFNLMKWYDGMGPFGVQFEAPVLLLKKVKIVKLNVLKGSYLKYRLTDDSGQIDALWFKGAKRFEEGSCVDVLINPQINEFNGTKSIQGLILDMHRA